MHLPALELPESLNYIGLFLTFECNLSCHYCINDPTQSGQRGSLFSVPLQSLREGLSPEQWSRALNRIPFRPDLPITLQGGEPMLYWRGLGLGMILSETPHYFDLLTNFAQKPEVFVRNLRGQQNKFQRDAPYPSIRVSYHPGEMNRVWRDRGFGELVERCETLGKLGFVVSPVKAESDVGIYMVAHPKNQVTTEMELISRGRLPFELKEFLGVDDSILYGHYLYPFSTDLILRGIHSQPLHCECRTTELLLDPLGFIWGCHLYLYEGWVRRGPIQEFNKLQAVDFHYKKYFRDIFTDRSMLPIGHLLDPDFQMTDLMKFRSCQHYGRCVGCDTKIKNDRFQRYGDHGIPHTSVEIRNIKMPASLLAKLDNLDAVQRFFEPSISD